MNHQSRSKERYPVFAAFGNVQEFLTHEQAIAATPQERIKSIWPFLIEKVSEFQRTLRPREQVNFDPEDTMTEIYVALMEKDGDWMPERSKYITFAGVIADRMCYAIRDRSRTVESPRNSLWRMKKYQAQADDGTLTERRRHTAASIAKTNDIASIIGSAFETGAVGVIVDNPVESMVGREDRAEVLKTLAAAVKKLPPFEAMVVGRLNGLWGNMPQSTWEVAFRTGNTASDVRKARLSAYAKLRAALSASGCMFVLSDK